MAWWADGTTWAVVGVAVAVISAAVTVWAQFAATRRIVRASHSAEAEASPLGRPVPGVDVTGDWVAEWQSWFRGVEVRRRQPVRIDHDRSDRFAIRALERGDELERGGFLWAGEVRLWDNAVLMGWYAADDSSVRSKGTLYFALEPHGQAMTGRWVGLSHDGIVSGEASLFRTAPAE